MTRLSVVIPALNEEGSISDVIARVLAVQPQLAQLGYPDLELIVVDDGSTDQTPQLVRSTPGVRLVQHSRNRGYGAALKTGFAAASGEWIGFLDADGTYPAEHLPELCRVGLTQNADMVIGSRMAGAQSQMPMVRRLGNRMFATLVGLLSARRVTDSASGMRLFRRTALERMYPLPDGLNLTPVMSTRALHEGLNVVEVPIPYSERVGRSKLSVVRDGVRFAQSVVWTALSYNPVRPLGWLGLAMIGLAGVAGAALVGARAAGITTVSPVGAFALFVALVLAVAGASTLTLGASFNHFVALFHRRPMRQGLFPETRLRFNADAYFGWLGLAAIVASMLLGASSLALGMAGWQVSRLWLYYLASASLGLVGLQLLIGWVQLHVLEALRERDAQVANDLRAIERDGVAAEPAQGPAFVGATPEGHTT